MQSVEKCYQGSNVRVFRLDREGVITRLRERARTLLGKDPTVLEVRLFGSLARGEGRPGSDADLFVVVRDGALPFLERIPELARHFGGVGIGCDVIAYTQSEYAALTARRDAFARAVIEEGRLLSRRPDGDQGSARASPSSA